MRSLRIRPLPRARRVAGYSLIELLVVMAIIGLLMAAVLSVFDVSNRMASVQTHITDMQQSLRAGQMEMSRYARMSGRGGLPGDLPLAAAPWIRGLAVEVRNNVDDSSPDKSIDVARSFAGTPHAVVGTDMLTVRGCFNTLFQVDETSATDYTIAPGNLTGTLTVRNPSKAGITQNLQALVGTAGRALLMVSPASETIYTVAQITAAAPDVDPNPTVVNLNLNLAASSYLALAGGVFDARLQAVSFACILEQYRYYVREEHLIPGDDTTDLVPKLTRAIMTPSESDALNEFPLDNNLANLSLDVADNVIDLQAAIAFDSDRPAGATTIPGAFNDDSDFIGNDDIVFEGATAGERATDDWLYNTPADDVSDVQWRQHRFAGNTSAPVQMQYLRLTTIARTGQPDPKYRAPLLGLIEDHDYAAPLPSAPNFNTDSNLRFRRRLLQTVIDLRNL